MSTADTKILDHITGGCTWVYKPMILNGCDDESQIWIMSPIKNNNECYCPPETAEKSLLHWQNK
jgi:hypothetical protein